MITADGNKREGLHTTLKKSDVIRSLFDLIRGKCCFSV
jgi:hypothetical protein